MESVIETFIGKKKGVYYPHLISSSKTVTLMKLLSLVDANNFPEAFVVLLLLNDSIPAFIQ